MVTAIEAARQRDPETKQDVPRAVVDVVPSLAALRERLGAPNHERPQVVVFRSLSMIETARVLKREYPSLKVVVFAGGISEDEIVIVYNGWSLSLERTQAIILDD